MPRQRGKAEMMNCQECGMEIEADKVTRFALHGHVPKYCETCGHKDIRRRDRNAARRERNAALRELCGTSARAAREDMGI